MPYYDSHSRFVGFGDLIRSMEPVNETFFWARLQNRLQILK